MKIALFSLILLIGGVLLIGGLHLHHRGDNRPLELCLFALGFIALAAGFIWLFAEIIHQGREP